PRAAGDGAREPGNGGRAPPAVCGGPEPGAREIPVGGGRRCPPAAGGGAAPARTAGPEGLRVELSVASVSPDPAHARGSQRSHLRRDVLAGWPQTGIEQPGWEHQTVGFRDGWGDTLPPAGAYGLG